MKFLGIDFGGTTVKSGLCAGDQIIESQEPIPTNAHESAEPLVDAIAERVAAIRAAHPDLAAIGIGVPGFVNFATGHVHRLTNVRGWDQIPLRQWLEDKTGLPVTVENDANCMAYAEWRHGAGQGADTMLAITLGTGVGGGLVLNGKLHRGASFGAGEVGQMSVNWQGRTGVYNNHGCLEQYIGHRQITARAIDAYHAAGIEKSHPECTPQNLVRAAREADPVARLVWHEVARILACQLCNICWLISPDRIVIGGGIAGAGDVLFAPLAEAMQPQLHPIFWQALQIVPARFGNEAGILGAAALATTHAQTTRQKA